MKIFAILTNAPTKTDQPVVIVEKWRKYEINGEAFIVCKIPKTGKVRVTTPIIYSHNQLFITESGRTYQCQGAESDDTPELLLALKIMGYK